MVDINRRALRTARRGPNFGEDLQVFFNLEAIDEDTNYVIIDLDGGSGIGGGVTVWPHRSERNSAVVPLRIRAELEESSSGVFEALLGVVKENDATNGSVRWFEAMRLEGGGRDVFDMEYRDGLNTKVRGGTPQYILSNLETNDDTGWDNDDYLTSPVGSTQPEAGDLVMWVNEVSGTGTVDVGISVTYAVL